jgi:hypothetical protein
MPFDPIHSAPHNEDNEENEENEVKIVELLRYDHVRPHLAFMPFECDVFMNH